MTTVSTIKNDDKTPTLEDDGPLPPQRNFFTAVTINSFNSSVYIKNSTFRGLSIQYDDNNNDNDNNDDDNDEEKEEEEQAEREGREDKKSSSRRHTTKNNYYNHSKVFASSGGISAAISSTVYSIPVNGSGQGNLTLESCTFQDNSANGGAVHVETLTFINDCHFEGNSGLLGGAISAISDYMVSDSTSQPFSRG